MTATWGLIGNGSAVAALRHSLTQDRLAHAYLLVGPDGVGKATLARALAQAVNCLQPDPPCGECTQCRRIANGLHPDVTVVTVEAGKREIGIHLIRELQFSLSLLPFEGRTRVTIIHDADRLTTEASNALLKTLEEPPPHVVLALTCHDEEALLPTIRSRCRRVALNPVATAELVQALETAHGVDRELAGTLARHARGLPGRALAAMADPEALAGVSRSIAQLRALVAADTPQRLELAAPLTGGGGAAREGLLALLRVWLDWWRDLLLVKTGCSSGLVFAAEMPNYEHGAAALGLPDIRRAVAAIYGASRQIDLNVNPRLALDVLVLRLPKVPGLTPT
ncbi:MAG: DNA polymerase III subunit delta' [Dehalococcoidia bacterium]|nr:DNA polymerase III subunit delta' [Dehalococcoidia bacterium]